MIQNDLLHEFIDKAIVSFCNRFRSCLLQLRGTDIENSKMFKYRVSYRVVIETYELLMKSCEKINFLFVSIQCATACLLKKVNFKVETAVSGELYQLFK